MTNIIAFQYAINQRYTAAALTGKMQLLDISCHDDIAEDSMMTAKW